MQKDVLTHMPTFRHLKGKWKGVVRSFDDQNNLVDQKDIYTTYSFDPNDHTPADKYHYCKKNEYLVNNDVMETETFLGSFAFNKVWFGDRKIEGWAADGKHDPYERTILAYWIPRDDEESYFYEFTIVDDMTYTLSSTIFWYKNNKMHQRIVVDQIRVEE